MWNILETLSDGKESSKPVCIGLLGLSKNPCLWDGTYPSIIEFNTPSVLTSVSQ